MSRCRVIALQRADAAGLRWHMPHPANVLKVMAGGVTLSWSDWWMNADRLELVHPASQVWAVVETGISPDANADAERVAGETPVPTGR